MTRPTGLRRPAAAAARCSSSPAAELGHVTCVGARVTAHTTLEALDALTHAPDELALIQHQLGQVVVQGLLNCAVARGAPGFVELTVRLQDHLLDFGVDLLIEVAEGGVDEQGGEVGARVERPTDFLDTNIEVAGLTRL